MALYAQLSGKRILQSRTLPGLLLLTSRGDLVGMNPVANRLLRPGVRVQFLHALRTTLQQEPALSHPPTLLPNSPAGPFLQSTFQAGSRMFGLQAFWLNHQPEGRPPLVAVLCERITPGRAGQRVMTKASRRFRLSPREMEVIQSLRTGMSDKEIAAKLGIGFETVRDYLKTIRRKLGVSTRTAIVNTLLTA
jgi:DNA-binding CsgD family transcriptional regulator